MRYQFQRQLRGKLLLVFLLMIWEVGYSQNNLIKVDSKRNPDNSVDFTYVKEYPGTLSVVVKFERLTNSRYSTYPRILRANSGRLFSLNAIDKQQGIGYSFSYTYIRGAIEPKVDKNFSYLLPFEKGDKVTVRELGNLGKSYFKKDLPRDWKGYQFVCERDTVYATRKGVVLEVVDNFEIDNQSNYTANTNRLLIEHDDGTIANYIGFAKAGIFVQPGMKVFPHSQLGTLSNGSERGRFYFFIYYMAKPNKYERAKKPDVIAVEQFVTPFFVTESGKVQLTPRKNYNVVKDEEAITFEMSKREKKRFKSGDLN